MFATIHRVGILAAAIFAVGLLFAPMASAQSGSVSVTVEVILAGNDGGGVADQLQPYSGRLRQQFAQFNSFEYVTSERFTLNAGESNQFSVPGGNTITVNFSGTSGNSYRMNVQLPGGGTTINSPAGGIFFVGGPRANGKSVILLFRTQ